MEDAQVDSSWAAGALQYKKREMKSMLVLSALQEHLKTPMIHTAALYDMEKND